MFQILMQKH